MHRAATSTQDGHLCVLSPLEVIQSSCVYGIDRWPHGTRLRKKAEVCRQAVVCTHARSVDTHFRLSRSKTNMSLSNIC